MTILFRRTLLVAGAAVVLAFAAVGIARFADGAGSSAPLPAPGGAGSGALLAADKTAAPERAAARAATRGQLRRLAAWSHLVHATVLVDVPALGGLTTVQLDHGSITTLGAGSLTIAETGGGSITVQLGAETRVRRHGAKAAVADLVKGDDVFVISKVTSGNAEAYLVVVPKAKA